MMKHTKLKYRALKTSWGIAIDIEGKHFEIQQNYTSSLKDISLEKEHKLRITTEFKLLQEEIEMIEKGLNLALQHLETNRKFLIQINKVEFNLYDFQLEGLTTAFYKWAIKHFEIENLEELSYSYNKDKNRYIFENL